MILKISPKEVEMIVMVIASAISAIATIVIAIYAGKSHELSVKSYQLAQEIKVANELKTKGDQEFREQVSDLYQAIVISTLLSGPGTYSIMDSLIDAFKSKYKGKTPIFK
jgi:hypothetical protein